jgi:hypothetical protein
MQQVTLARVREIERATSDDLTDIKVSIRLHDEGVSLHERQSALCHMTRLERRFGELRAILESDW